MEHGPSTLCFGQAMYAVLFSVPGFKEATDCSHRIFNVAKTNHTDSLNGCL